MRPTEQTTTANLRLVLLMAAKGSQKLDYPNGPGAHGVLVEMSDAERLRYLGDATRHYEEWKTVNEPRARQWSQACADNGRVLCPDAWRVGVLADL